MLSSITIILYLISTLTLITNIANGSLGSADSSEEARNQKIEEEEKLRQELANIADEITKNWAEYGNGYWKSHTASKIMRQIAELQGSDNSHKSSQRRRKSGKPTVSLMNKMKDFTDSKTMHIVPIPLSVQIDKSWMSGNEPEMRQKIHGHDEVILENLEGTRYQYVELKGCDLVHAMKHYPEVCGYTPGWYWRAFALAIIDLELCPGEETKRANGWWKTWRQHQEQLDLQASKEKQPQHLTESDQDFYIPDTDGDAMKQVIPRINIESATDVGDRNEAGSGESSNEGYFGFSRKNYPRANGVSDSSNEETADQDRNVYAEPMSREHSHRITESGIPLSDTPKTDTIGASEINAWGPDPMQRHGSRGNIDNADETGRFAGQSIGATRSHQDGNRDDVVSSGESSEDTSRTHISQDGTLVSDEQNESQDTHVYDVNDRLIQDNTMSRQHSQPKSEETDGSGLNARDTMETYGLRDDAPYNRDGAVDTSRSHVDENRDNVLRWGDIVRHNDQQNSRRGSSASNVFDDEHQFPDSIDDLSQTRPNFINVDDSSDD